MLSLIVFLPIVGMIIVTLLPGRKAEWIKWTSVLFTALPFALSIELWRTFDRSTASMQFVERSPWIPSFNIHYFIGIDGLSLPMLFLTTLLGFLCCIASWKRTEGVKGYFAMFLLLVTGMLGVFCSLDFFLFYIFWELMLLPMYFLIGIWGGPKREYAAIKFFLYTLFGSVLMLLAMLAFYFYSEPHTFDLLALTQQGFAGHDIDFFGLTLPFDLFRKILFIGLFIGFAIKVPIFPFHTWLPLAHVEAPTAISVILAGVLLKMGTYGLLRISFPILPAETNYFAFAMAVLGLINILYGAFCAMAQITLPEEKGGNDLKKLVAYSSISHMGYVLLGMAVFTSEGMQGAVLQMFNHGTSTAMLFLLVGVIYDRVHHRKINGFGGLWNQMPVYTGICALAFFASLGLPALSGFISEALVFLGSFQVYRTITALALIGVVITAGYFLWSFQKIFMGQLDPRHAALKDLTARELVTLVPLSVIIVYLGIYPMPMLAVMQVTLNNLITLVK
ncbi:MAG: NADH-quinone oxidoreductase subunit M [Deltaproteobacteria bacterium]|nr:NADH-quinone oxidoreductase subunit M [Deltaproteobacteria bacterium]